MTKNQKIRGVVLAGGTGSRLNPLTKVTNKHLLPVGQKPMIFYRFRDATARRSSQCRCICLVAPPPV